MPVSSGFKYHSLVQMIAMIDQVFLGMEEGSEPVMFTNKRNRTHGTKTRLARGCSYPSEPGRGPAAPAAKGTGSCEVGG